MIDTVPEFTTKIDGTCVPSSLRVTTQLTLACIVDPYVPIPSANALLITAADIADMSLCLFLPRRSAVRAQPPRRDAPHGYLS